MRYPEYHDFDLDAPDVKRKDLHAWVEELVNPTKPPPGMEEMGRLLDEATHGTDPETRRAARYAFERGIDKLHEEGTALPSLSLRWLIGAVSRLMADPTGKLSRQVKPDRCRWTLRRSRRGRLRLRVFFE